MFSCMPVKQSGPFSYSGAEKKLMVTFLHLWGIMGVRTGAVAAEAIEND